MSEHALLPALRNFIHRQGLVGRGERVVVAVSGGIDSVVLLDMMVRITSELHLGLAAAHFNHQLRGGESDEDEAFVRKLASEHQIECYVERANTREVSE